MSASRDTLIPLIGFLAGFGTTFAALPDFLAMLKRRSSAGINARMAAIIGTFQILWVIYGALIGSANVVMWNVIAVVINYVTVAAYLYFRRRENGDGSQPDATASWAPGSHRRRR